MVQLRQEQDPLKKLEAASVANTKKRWGREYRTDWFAVAELLTSRTKKAVRHEMAKCLETQHRPEGWT
jgi:hypothetical protein